MPCCGLRGVAAQQLELAADHAALGVRLVDRELIAARDLVAVKRDRAGIRIDRADADRLLRAARRRRRAASRQRPWPAQRAFRVMVFLPRFVFLANVRQTSAKRASATPCSSSIFSCHRPLGLQAGVRIDDVGDQARAFVELDQRDVVGKLRLERLVIGVVIDHPAHDPALAGGLGPVPLGGEAVRALGARRQPGMAHLRQRWNVRRPCFSASQ